MTDQWIEIKRPVQPAYYGGGTILPSGTYSQAPLAPQQEVVWTPIRLQGDSPMYVVAFGAAEINAEAASERQWKEAFTASQDFLTEWGDRVLADFLAGNTEPLDPDDL